MRHFHTFDEHISLHPDIVAAKNCLKDLKIRMEYTNSRLCRAISQKIYDFGEQFESEESACARKNRSRERCK